MNQPDLNAIKQTLLDLQDEICQGLLTKEPKPVQFHEDNWEKAHLKGGGRTRILRNQSTFEQAGVNFSHVRGDELPKAATASRPELKGRQFEAMGISLVIHPQNPFVPTTHFNIRFFLAHSPDKAPIWWFGGGFDLTPYYGFEEDCQHWHQVAYNACQPFGPEVYPKFKKWCDDYFYLKHRQEPRGIGGIFFDDLNEWGFQRCFEFFKSVGHHFLLAYLPIVQRRKDIPFTEKERKFQLYRRGRYVEYNLVYDRGTLFGLQTGGRTESILMSLPPRVEWTYNWQPEAHSKEAQLYTDFLKPKEWLPLQNPQTP